MNVFQTEIKITILNRPLPISVLTFSRKSLNVVVMDLNVCCKQRAEEFWQSFTLRPYATSVLM